jgi:hypothetical protein
MLHFNQGLLAGMGQGWTDDMIWTGQLEMLMKQVLVVLSERTLLTDL